LCVPHGHFCLLYRKLTIMYSLQVNETELEVSSDSASYKQRLEVLQQQEELIEDEEEQEAKEAESRRLKKEAEEETKRAEAEKQREAEEASRAEAEKGQADAMLPESEVSFDAPFEAVSRGLF
jgi:LETM1 and EF-hand domain-containing protein 1